MKLADSKLLEKIKEKYRNCDIIILQFIITYLIFITKSLNLLKLILFHLLNFVSVSIKQFIK